MNLTSTHVIVEFAQRSFLIRLGIKQEYRTDRRNHVVPAVDRRYHVPVTGFHRPNWRTTRASKSVPWQGQSRRAKLGTNGTSHPWLGYGTHAWSERRPDNYSCKDFRFRFDFILAYASNLIDSLLK